MSSTRQRLRQIADNPRTSLHCVLGGTSIGCAGILTVYGAEKLLPSSAAQELVAAGGLLFIGAGTLMALRGYFGLSILRLFRLFDDSQH